MTARIQAGSRQVLVPARAIISVALAGGAAVLAGEALTTYEWPQRAVVWGGLALAALAFSLLCLVGLRQGDDLGLARWSLGSWVLLWYGLAFGLATVTFAGSQTGASAEIALPSVLRAIWLVGVGMTVWVAGYLCGPGRLLRELASSAITKLSQRFSIQVRSRSAPWILYFIGIAGRLASTATTGRFGYTGDVSSAVSSASGYQQLLTALSLCAPLAVAAAALQVYWERLPGARVTLTALFLSELAFGAAAGGKQSFVIAVLAVAIPFSAARHRLPTIALVLLPLTFMLFVIPFNKAYRSEVRSSSGTLSPSQALAVAPTILRDTVTGQNPLTLLPSSTGYLLQRIREIDAAAIIMQRTPEQIPYVNPAQLIEAPVMGMVPRSIWPGKPIITTGYEVSQAYYELPSSVYTSSAVTPVGDLYRHGGWVPVIAGMFFLGWAVRLLDDVLNVRENPHAIFLILLVFPVLVKSETDWASLFAGIPSTLAIWVFAVALVFRQRRKA